MANNLIKINFFSRYALAFVFFYHGLIPKILWLSQVESNLVLAHNLNVSASTVSFIAGLLEILLAGAIIFYRRSLIPIYFAAMLLVTLLIDVALVMPKLLIEAFNPVTINIASLIICYLIYLSQQELTT